MSEKFTQPNSFDSMEGVPELSRIAVTFQEEPTESIAVKHVEESKDRLAQVRDELTSPKEKRELSPEWQERVEKIKNRIGAEIRTYFQECASIQQARDAKRTIMQLHGFLLDDPVNMPLEELHALEDSFVEQYGTPDGEPIIRYKNIFAKWKDKLDTRMFDSGDKETESGHDRVLRERREHFRIGSGKVKVAQR